MPSAPNKVYIIQQTSFAYNDGYVTSYKPEKFYLTRAEASNALADLIIEAYIERWVDSNWWPPVGSEIYVKYKLDYSEEDRAEALHELSQKDADFSAIGSMQELHKYVKTMKRPKDSESDWWAVHGLDVGVCT